MIISRINVEAEDSKVDGSGEIAINNKKILDYQKLNERMKNMSKISIKPEEVEIDEKSGKVIIKNKKVVDYLRKKLKEADEIDVVGQAQGAAWFDNCSCANK